MKPEAMTFPITRQGVRDLDRIQGRVLPASVGPAPPPADNVGTTERLLSGIAGGVLTAVGLGRFSPAGVGLALLGAALGYRALTGYCHLYQALGVNTSEHAGVESRAELAYRVR
jgi:uncharacterized membrane protein